MSKKNELAQLIKEDGQLFRAVINYLIEASEQVAGSVEEFSGEVIDKDFFSEALINAASIIKERETQDTSAV